MPGAKSNGQAERIRVIARAGARALLIALLLALPTGRALANSATPPATSLPAAGDRGTPLDLSELYAAVVDAVDRLFVDPKLVERIGWRARAEALRASVLAAPSREGAVALINQLLDELKTSHTGLYTPDDFRYYITLDVLRGAGSTAGLIASAFPDGRPAYPGIGVFTTEVNGKHFIDGVLEGSQAEKAGLKFGDEMLTVDGQPYRPIAAFRGKVGATAALHVRRKAESDPRRHDLPVESIVPSAAFSAAIIASARVIERRGQRIGYVHIWSTNMMSSIRTAFASLDLPALDAVIVDMRGRVGGNIGVAGQMLDLLGTAEKPYWGHWRSLNRLGENTGPVADRAMPINAASAVTPFKGRSAILIDHQTRSASEIMAYGYQRSRFGAVIGTPTAGAIAGGSPQVMPGGLLLYIAASRQEFDGRNLDGIGVIPDQRVERPIPYADGADPVLDAAIDRLSQP